MKVAPDCIPCILSQVLRVARRVSDDEWIQRKVLKEAMEPLGDPEEHLGPSELSAEIVRDTLRTLGAPDPFAEDRLAHVQLARALVEEMAPKVTASADPLAAALALSAAANAFDRLLVDPRVDVEAEIRSALSRGLASTEGDDFREELAAAKRVLFVFDTAGAVPFDLLLIEQLGERDVVGAVRPSEGGLSATFKDLIAAGIGDDMKLVAAGVETGSLALDSPEFRSAVDEADVVIAKGLTAYDLLRVEDTPVFVLMSVKCEVAARALGVPVAGLVLVRP